MIILHCAQTEIGLLFWAERKIEKTAGKTRSSRKVRPHPFALDCASLFDALDIRGAGGESDGLTPTEALIWLPARGGRPIPSNPILGEKNSDNELTEISPFRVDALHADPFQAVALLAATRGKKVVKSGVLAGSDTSYWGETLQLAGAIVACQEYLPSIRITGAEHYSVWEPVLPGETQKLFTETAKAMPPVARGPFQPCREQPSRGTASEVFKEFLTDCVDQLVRSTIFDDALKPFQPSQHLTQIQSVHDAWRHALRSANRKIRWNPKETTEVPGEESALDGYGAQRPTNPPMAWTVDDKSVVKEQESDV